MITSAVMAEKHPADFAKQALTLRGRTRHYYASDPQGMTRPSRLPGTDLWVETNLSAKDILARVHQLLELFDHSAEDLVIMFDSEG